MIIDQIIDGVIGREGAYSNNPNDTGGETMWGVTVAVARANGYSGPMRDMPRSEAVRIYRKRYVLGPGFDQIELAATGVGAKLVDVGVNMGPEVAGRFLQRALNALNRGGADYADLLVDGHTGPATVTALRGYVAKRGIAGMSVLLKAINALQGERYIALAESRAANEQFEYGWLANRVGAL